MLNIRCKPPCYYNAISSVEMFLFGVFEDAVDKHSTTFPRFLYLTLPLCAKILVFQFILVLHKHKMSAPNNIYCCSTSQSKCPSLLLSFSLSLFITPFTLWKKITLNLVVHTEIFACPILYLPYIFLLSIYLFLSYVYAC